MAFSLDLDCAKKRELWRNSMPSGAHRLLQHLPEQRYGRGIAAVVFPLRSAQLITRTRSPRLFWPAGRAYGEVLSIVAVFARNGRTVLRPSSISCCTTGAPPNLTRRPLGSDFTIGRRGSRAHPRAVREILSRWARTRSRGLRKRRPCARCTRTIADCTMTAGLFEVLHRKV